MKEIILDYKDSKEALSNLIYEMEKDKIEDDLAYPICDIINTHLKYLNDADIDFLRKIASRTNKPIQIIKKSEIKRKSSNYLFFSLYKDRGVYIELSWIKRDNISSERQKMSNSLRYRILQQYNNTCQICGATSPNVKLHIDHIIPISKGGTTSDENLWVLCSDCNLGKSAKLPSDEEIKSIKQKQQKATSFNVKEKIPFMMNPDKMEKRLNLKDQIKVYRERRFSKSV